MEEGARPDAGNPAARSMAAGFLSEAA